MFFCINEHPAKYLQTTNTTIIKYCLSTNCNNTQ